MRRITDGTGTKLETLAFDPWGRRRNPSNWSFTDVPAGFLFDRGYTGHEHLDRFGLINMNGRVYDPALARFLSPDPFITNPANSQNYNRYSYCLNNPLKYTDPSGYNQHEKPWDYDMEPQLCQIHFGGSGGGWSNWSNPFAGAQAHDFIMMNSTAFNNVWGKGASDIGRALYNDPVAFAQWSAGKTSIETVRQDGGYWSPSVLPNSVSEPTWIDTPDGCALLLGGTNIGKMKWHAVDGTSGQEGYKDVTTAFDAQLENTMAYFSISRDWFDINYPKGGLGKEIDKMMFFRSKVNDNAVFDIKRTAFSRANLGAEYGIYRGQEFRYDDFGNYNYGVAAKYFGLTLDRALLGAGLNQISKFNPDFSNPGGYFDHSHDTEMIIRGYYHKW